MKDSGFKRRKSGSIKMRVEQIMLSLSKLKDAKFDHVTALARTISEQLSTENEVFHKTTLLTNPVYRKLLDDFMENLKSGEPEGISTKSTFSSDSSNLLLIEMSNLRNENMRLRHFKDTELSKGNALSLSNNSQLDNADLIKTYMALEKILKFFTDLVEIDAVSGCVESLERHIDKVIVEKDLMSPYFAWRSDCERIRGAGKST